MPAEMKVHIKYPKRFQVTAVRAQVLVVASGIKCSIDPEKKPGTDWTRICITKQGSVEYSNVSSTLIFHICRMIESLLALGQYADRRKDAKS